MRSSLTDFSQASEYLVVDEDEWESVEAVFELLAEGWTSAEIVEEVEGIRSTGTITKLRDRREMYEEFRELPG